MHCRFFTAISILCASAALAGCGTIRHDNVLLFGTDTSLGITAGTTATNVAQASVGYRRQEAVVLPLTANQAGDHDNLAPCVVAGHPECKYVAEYGGQSRDAYSVVATFGSNFAAGSGASPNATGGISQTFATGVAAQILAIKGGAALVATGPAAEASASADISGELSALVNAPANAGDTPTRQAHRVQLSAALSRLSGDALLAEMRRISTTATGSAAFIENRCTEAGQTDRQQCAVKIAENNQILSNDIVEDFYRAQQTPASGGQ